MSTRSGRIVKSNSRRAIELVVEEERKRLKLNNRNEEPQDVSGRKVGYDVRSAERRIEVKAETRSWEERKSSSQRITENEMSNATHLYIVFDIEGKHGKPDIHKFDLAKVPIGAIRVRPAIELSFAKCRSSEIEDC